MRATSNFRRLLQDRKAAVSVITAVSLVMMVGFSGAAVDFGSVFLQTRQLQGMTDLAAMAAAGDLSQAQLAAQESAAQNNWNLPITTTATTGTYTPNSDIPVNQRFTPNTASPNAARVTLASTANLYFASLLLGKKSLAISRTATAAQGALASFAMGTELASLNGGVENALLSGLTGSSISLDVMDYNELLGAQVDLFQYTQALATRLNLKGVSYNQTLATQVTTGTALGAIVDILNAAGNTAAANAVGKIISGVNSQTITVGQLLDLGPYGSQDYIQTNGPSGFSVDALQLANAMLLLAQGGRQVQLNLNGLIPGVGSITAWLAIGQQPSNSPWLTITGDNSVVISTAQARLYVDAQVSPVGLSGVTSVNLPIYTELASAQAKLSSVTCGSNESVTVSVAPSIGETAIGTVDTTYLNDFTHELTISPATMVNVLNLVTATGQAQINVGGNDWQNLSFDANAIQNHTIETADTTNAISETLTSLLGNLSINVQIFGLGLGISKSAITNGIISSLNAVATPLDNVVDGVTDLLGIGLGEAHVWVNGVRCQGPVLAQ